VPACNIARFRCRLRTICTVSLSWNTETDRTKAIGYIEQALSVMEGHSESLGDEDKVSHVRMIQNLLKFTLWMNVNNGLQHRNGVSSVSSTLRVAVTIINSLKSSSCNFDEAKRCFEAATVTCRFVPGGSPVTEGMLPFSYSPLVDLTYWKIRIQPSWHIISQKVKVEQDICSSLIWQRYRST